MWPKVYWPQEYWAGEYWPPIADVPPPSGGGQVVFGIGQKKSFAAGTAELGGGGW